MYGDFWYELSTLLWNSAIVWLPLLLLYIFGHLWLRYIRREYIQNIDWALLEIRIPREVSKSPQAMEIVLQSLYDTSRTGTWHKRWWQGRVRYWSSLEIVSIEGRIYFFVRIVRGYVDFFSSYLYSQYPGAEIREVDDYIKYVPPYHPDNDWELFGFERILAQPDAYPLMTYVDFGMDQDLGLKEEQRLDPLSPVLEYMSTMRQTEHIYVQFLIRAATKKYRDPSRKWWQVKYRDWREEARSVINDLKTKTFKSNLELVQSVVGDENQQAAPLASFTDEQKRLITALERSTTKKGFEVCMRTMYYAKKDHFRSEAFIGMINMWKHVGTAPFNALSIDERFATDFDYDWQDIRGYRMQRRQQKMFDAYRQRSGFYWPYPRKTFILTTEELATLFHLPSATVESQSFERIDSKRAEPPINLPI